MIVSIIQLGLMVLMLFSLWKIFEKFGEPGWAAIVPFYNIYIMTRIARWNWEPVKILLFLIPIYNIYLSYLLYKDIAGRFGKGTVGFAIGMLLLPFVFFPILAFREEVVN